MVRARHDKLAELAQLVVVARVGHIARGRSIVTTPRQSAQPPVCGPLLGSSAIFQSSTVLADVLHRLHQQIDRGDGASDVPVEHSVS